MSDALGGQALRLQFSPLVHRIVEVLFVQEDMLPVREEGTLVKDKYMVLRGGADVRLTA